MASFEEHIRKAASSISDVELTEELKRTVMASCDVRSILESWNVHPMHVHGNQWEGYCPDHMLHDGHAQHLPHRLSARR